MNINNWGGGGIVKKNCAAFENGLSFKMDI